MWKSTPLERVSVGAGQRRGGQGVHVPERADPAHGRREGTGRPQEHEIGVGLYAGLDLSADRKILPSARINRGVVVDDPTGEAWVRRTEQS